MTRAEHIRHVFALVDAGMTIPALVHACCEHGVFRPGLRYESMAAACRQALRQGDEDGLPFALRLPRRRVRA